MRRSSSSPRRSTRRTRRSPRRSRRSRALAGASTRSRCSPPARCRASLPENCRVRTFGARDEAGTRAALRACARPPSCSARAPSRSSRTCARSTRCSPRRSRARSACRCCSGTRTGTRRPTLRLAERVVERVLSVDRRSFPLDSAEGARDRPRDRPDRVRVPDSRRRARQACGCSRSGATRRRRGSTSFCARFGARSTTASTLRLDAHGPALPSSSAATGASSSASSRARLGERVRLEGAGAAGARSPGCSREPTCS